MHLALFSVPLRLNRSLMKRSSVILVHMAFWALSVMIPSVLLLTYKSQITQGMMIYQLVTHVYYAIVFYFIYLLIVPITFGSSNSLFRNIVIFLAAVIFLWFIKIGKTVITDYRFGLGLDKYNIYSITLLYHRSYQYYHIYPLCRFYQAFNQVVQRKKACCRPAYPGTPHGAGLSENAA